VLLVPSNGASAPPKPEVPQEKPVVVVPAEKFTYPDKRRVFYRVVAGDSPRDIALALSVSLGDLCRWNAIDTSAALHDAMVLQAFVPKNAALSQALVTEEEHARVLAVGSPEFFDHFESIKGRKRIEVVTASGDTWRGLSKRYGLSLGMLERINHRSRSSALVPGDKVIVYVAAAKPAAPTKAPAAPAPENEQIEEKPDRPLPVELAEGEPAAPAEGGGDSAPKESADAPAPEPKDESATTVLAKDAKDPPASTAAN
jgi:membrane-bound lytic murein transglycosylase D